MAEQVVLQKLGAGLPCKRVHLYSPKYVKVVTVSKPQSVFYQDRPTTVLEHERL